MKKFLLFLNRSMYFSKNCGPASFNWKMQKFRSNFLLHARENEENFATKNNFAHGMPRVYLLTFRVQTLKPVKFKASSDRRGFVFIRLNQAAKNSTLICPY